MHITTNNPNLVLFMIIDFVGSTCYSSIVKNEPLPIREITLFIRCDSGNFAVTKKILIFLKKSTCVYQITMLLLLSVKQYANASIAQLVEHPAVNRQVTSSSLV